MSEAEDPEDEPSISDDAELWRRIPWKHWTPDSSEPKGRRVSSAAFDDMEMSVVIAAECTGGEATLLAGHGGYGIARFKVSDVRALDCRIVRDPIDDLPGHALVFGLGGRAPAQRRKRQDLTKHCRVEPIPVDPTS